MGESPQSRPQPEPARPAGGSAAVQGSLWGWRARDWSELQEPQQAPLFARAIEETGIGPRTRVLDLGCGAGVFCRMAADHGARVSGIDAAGAHVALARERTPGADLRVGDMQFLPWADAAFDVLCWFTSLQFAADRRAALREGRRVASPGARAAIFVWGPDERCEIGPLMLAWRPFLPPPPPGAPPPVPLWTPGVLEELVAGAGWAPERTGDLETVWDYADEERLARAMLSSAGGRLAVERAGEAAVRTATLDALAPFRAAGGAYRIRNAWRYLIASA